MLVRAEILSSQFLCMLCYYEPRKNKGPFLNLYENPHVHPKNFCRYVGMSSSNFNKLFFITPNTAYKNTVMRMSVLPQKEWQ